MNEIKSQEPPCNNSEAKQEQASCPPSMNAIEELTTQFLDLDSLTPEQYAQLILQQPPEEHVSAVTVLDTKSQRPTEPKVKVATAQPETVPADLERTPGIRELDESQPSDTNRAQKANRGRKLSFTDTLTISMMVLLSLITSGAAAQKWRADNPMICGYTDSDMPQTYRFQTNYKCDTNKMNDKQKPQT